MYGSSTLLGVCALALSLRALGDASQPAPGAEAAGGLVTLRAADDRTASFDFDAGQHAARLEDGQLLLDDADLAFNLLQPGSLSFGFRRNELATLVDLGDLRVEPVPTVRDLAPKPAASVFATLRRQDGRLYYQAPANKTLRLEAAERVFLEFPLSAPQHVVPVVGHVYVLRWIDPGAPVRTERFVKFQVLELLAAQSVTLRWAPL